MINSIITDKDIEFISLSSAIYMFDRLKCEVIDAKSKYPYHHPKYGEDKKVKLLDYFMCQYAHYLKRLTIYGWKVSNKTSLKETKLDGLELIPIDERYGRLASRVGTNNEYAWIFDNFYDHFRPLDFSLHQQCDGEYYVNLNIKVDDFLEIINHHVQNTCPLYDDNCHETGLYKVLSVDLFGEKIW